MSPADTLAAARRLVDSASEGTAGLWARAAAILARQALETAIKIRLAKKIPGVEDVCFRVQLLCLFDSADEGVAGRAGYAWSTLSRATHHQGYELPPTAASLRQWISDVERLLDELAA